MRKVNKANFRLWVKALRSGQYKQGKGYLKQEERGIVEHCCLGVACEVALANGVPLDTELNHGVYRFDERTGVLPDAVIFWLGLPRQTVDPLIEGNSTATSVNDSNVRPYAFEQIADAIVRTYELEETDEPA